MVRLQEQSCVIGLLSYDRRKLMILLRQNSIIFSHLDVIFFLGNLSCLVFIQPLTYIHLAIDALAKFIDANRLLFVCQSSLGYTIFSPSSPNSFQRALPGSQDPMPCQKSDTKDIKNEICNYQNIPIFCPVDIYLKLFAGNLYLRLQIFFSSINFY